MFIRKKPNKTGVISIQIIDKSSGKYKVAKTIGSSKDPEQIKQLEIEARNFLNGNQLKLFKPVEEIAVENFLQDLSNSQIHTIGPELIFGTLFDRIGFNAIPEELFKHIVVARLVYPTSKLKTADYLYRYKGVSVEIQRIYRFLDRLNKKHKETAEKIAYEYTQRTLKNVSVVFYDMTTLYFESEDEDDLRKIGFSKDGKFQNPQIMLGLLVGQNGYPIGYDIFEGNAYEGHTLIPTLKSIQKKYGFPKPIVVADAGLLSKDNIEKLKAENYQFILGARIKNESEPIKKEILEKALGLPDGANFQIKKPDTTTLVVGYSDKRKRKDEYNRKKGIAKLKQKIKFGKLTKASINNRGYNKFLSLTGEIDVIMNEEKIKADESWDGLKGYITNTTLKPEEVMENYRHLWQIEKAFRISKTDLKVRPIYHYKRRRIEAHICIAFVAYTIWKELERLLDEHEINMSPKRAVELTQNMYQLEYMSPDTDEIKKIILKMDSEQETLRKIVCGN
jgi:transposase